MGNQIIVLNRVEAEEFDCGQVWACISIANTEDDFPPIPDENRHDLIQLAFADITMPANDFILFHDDHAHDILDFVTRNWDAIDTLMVHCDAGISRSSAVAAAIAHLKLDDESEFFEEPFDPNPRVYQTLREVATGRGDYQNGMDEWD